MFYHLKTSWKELARQANEVLMDKEAFVAGRHAFNECIKCPGFSLNLHHQLINNEILLSLNRYAIELNVENSITGIFSGEKLNISENRNIVHAIYRSPRHFKGMPFFSKYAFAIEQNLSKMALLAKKADAYETLIHIGMGGSDLGPKLVVNALSRILPQKLDAHFISNLDASGLDNLFARIDKNKTLVVIASKSFTTYETRVNAKYVLSWLGEERIAEQVLAITESTERAELMGIKLENCLEIFSGVGGRFSVFSPIGLSIALCYGMDAFNQFLHGGSEIDDLILENKTSNMALQLALVDFWNINFIGVNSLAFIPYSEALSVFVPYLQQLMMESNGKHVSKTGLPLSYATCPIIWGGVGPSSQHSFHQLLMQGANQISIEFIKLHSSDSFSDKLEAQLMGQSQALWFGATSLCEPEKKISGLKQHSIFSMESLTPKSLGQLLAIYEYRTIYLGFLWGINSFDQPGVELGKKLALQNETKISDKSSVL